MSHRRGAERDRVEHRGMSMHRARLSLAAALLLVTLGALAGGRAGWLATKAALAQVLLEHAWSETRTNARAVRPWPWADITPVARLEVPEAGVSLVVLQDASGEAMAFGPGLVAGDPTRAARTAVVLGGHRDSHLAFLEHLPLGAPLVLEDRRGARHAYRLERKDVVDSRGGRFAVRGDAPALLLITCYPFRATQSGGPLRLVAMARPVARAGPSRDARYPAPDAPSNRASNG